MLIKSADSREADLAELTALMRRPGLDAERKKRIEQEIRFIQSGLRGEQETAYEIDFHHGSSKNWAVIHDLRIHHRGRVAQIDHLLVNRFMEIWVFESKRFSEGIAINEQGECAMFWGGRPQGIASPHEQNAKHMAVLKALCDDGAVELPKRLGFAIKPSFSGLVVVSKNARISRPSSKGWWSDGIVKADQVRSRILKDIDDDMNVLGVTKVVSSGTLETFAKQLAAMHRPAAFNWPAKFGLPAEVTLVQTKVVAEAAVPVGPAPERAPGNSKWTCFACQTPVELKVARFCWFQKAKFGGQIYCQSCQAPLSEQQGDLSRRGSGDIDP
jgi:Nuclease-related domain